MVCAQSRVVLPASHDNTLYQSPIDQEGQRNELSNGAGNFLFTGRTGQDAGFRLRRSLIRFDLQSVLPPGTRIVAASLSLYQTRAAPGSPPAQMGLHRVLQAWGEGDSMGIGPEGQGNFAEPGDATWHHRIFPDDLWDAEGGSFVTPASAVVTVGQSIQTYVWPCTQPMVQDLQLWQDNPQLNFGWELIGGEIAGSSAHRFSSRENENEDQRPALTIYYVAEDSFQNNGFESPLSCP